MIRFSLHLVLVALLAIPIGCRVSHRRCCQPACYHAPVPDPAPLAQPEPAAAETARRSLSDDDLSDESFPELFDYDPAVPPTPALDVEA